MSTDDRYQLPSRELLDAVLGRPAWMRDALCLEHPGVDWMNERGRNADLALEVCGRCLCRVDCLEYALADATLLGVWGGTTTKARNVIRRNRTKEAR